VTPLGSPASHGASSVEKQIAFGRLFPGTGRFTFGFTPLHYAVTLHSGTTDTLKELLKAGADRHIRNPKGRTPLEEARRYKHSRLADALK
jgi:ankyrin repeat protein